MVWHRAMNAYATALADYLKEGRQADLANAVGCKQATISRYATGNRFPDRNIAEKIDKATEGKVPLAIWMAAAAKHFGLAA